MSSAPTKVLFLDVDGVLNSTRTAILHGFPFGLDEMHKMDQTALGLVRHLCAIADVAICMSSTWRLGRHPADLANAFDLPVFDKTGNGLGCRGDQIKEWLSRHPEVEQYAILDDDSDMLLEQSSRFVRTEGHEGLSFVNYLELCELFGVNPHDKPPTP